MSNRVPGIHIPRKKVKFYATMLAEPKAPPPDELNAVRGAFDPVEVELHRQRYHLSMICAHCVHWFRGRDRDVRTMDGRPACASPGPCGGLANHMTYPEYEGSIAEVELKTKCCVCGEFAPKAFRVGTGHLVGYCEKHLDEVKQLTVKDRR